MISVIILIAGIGLLYWGAEALVTGASSTARRLGISPMIVGITVIAYGTSMPELIVSIEAALKNAPNIAVSNVVGSNICTVGLVLGTATALRSMKVQMAMIRWHAPLMFLATVALGLCLMDGVLSRVEGALLAVGIVIYTGLNIKQARKENAESVLKEFDEAVPMPRRPAWADGVLILAGATLMYFGGDLLIDGATDLAMAFGVSEWLIGVTIVAVGTSCPDLVASAVAAMKKEPDLAVGNVIGSVIFNTFSAMGFAALIQPLNGFDVRPFDILFMVGISLLMLPLMRSKLVLHRWEGWLLISAYTAYLAISIICESSG